MKCNTAKKNLIALIDDELDAGLRNEVKSHLRTCRKCAQDYQLLMNLYLPAAEIEPVQMDDDFIWQNLSREIQLSQAKPSRLSSSHFLPKLATAALLLVILLSAVAFGIFLGNFPTTAASNGVIAEAANQLAQEAHLDAFYAMPRGSIIEAYYSLENNNIK